MKLLIIFTCISVLLGWLTIIKILAHLHDHLVWLEDELEAKGLWKGSEDA